MAKMIFFNFLFFMCVWVGRESVESNLFCVSGMKIYYEIHGIYYLKFREMKEKIMQYTSI